MRSCSGFPDFPPKLRVLVEHMILSHHGELEYGSPKLPLFPEALLLHHLDNLDSKMECMRALVAKDRLVEGDWTGVQRFARALGVEKRKISGRSPPVPSPPPRRPIPLPAWNRRSTPRPRLSHRQLLHPSKSRRRNRVLCSLKNWDRPGVKTPEMPRSGAREIPPPLEVECLKALWTLREGSVKDVQRALTGNRSLAYTTVMTVLDRLARKGGVSRRKVGRSFVYVPVLSRETLRRLALQDLVDRYFEGSREALLELLREG